VRSSRLQGYNGPPCRRHALSRHDAEQNRCDTRLAVNGFLQLEQIAGCLPIAQRAAGVKPLRRIYDLRHTFVTFALRAGISTFDLSRYMGASRTMIDRHYGHLAREGREHAIRLVDELSERRRSRWTLVDAAWTPTPANSASRANGNTS
jgi:integrase